MTGILVLVRHGESEWNQQNLFTGWRDPDLTENGESQAIDAGKRIASLKISFDILYTSLLVRAQRTGQYILDELNQSDLETICDRSLNERDYGDLSGLNKDDARAKWGDDQVYIWRRSYDTPPPNGESLKDTKERVVPYYNESIRPRLLRGEKVLIAAHGNSLRALIMDLENIPKEEINDLELKTGVPIIYHFDSNGTIESKQILDSD